MHTAKRKASILGMSSALAIFALGGTAIAGDHPNKAYDTKAEATMEKHSKMAAKGKEDAMKKASAYGVSDLGDIEDWEVMHNGNELGSIDRLGVDRETGELIAIVGLEGVLGANMKEVAIPLEKLEKAGDETLSTGLTKEELQQKRDVDPWDGTFTQVLNKNDMK
jgi:hypothetical protein